MFRTVALAGLLSLASGASPYQNRPLNLEAADCSRINMMYGDFEVGRAEQHGTVPLSAGTLEIRPDWNGGVQIERGSGGAYSITACIAAGARTSAEAQSAADHVRLLIEGGRVRVTGMSETSNAIRNWSVQLIVGAPDGAAVEAETTNGPISASGVSGTFSLRASNGPISLSDVSGRVNARAYNGPIGIDGSRGEFDVETSNGPITVKLTGDRWDGRLDARAANGPLTVTIPADYQSGVEISSSAESPWTCRASACRSASESPDERRRSLRVGAAPIVVHLSTVNGPVTVRER